MQNAFEEVRKEALARLDKLFPDLLMVELGLAGPAVGVGRTTWHRHNLQGHPPFPATRIGNKRYVSIMDLATFVAQASAGASRPVQPEHIEVPPPAAPASRGRPTHQEVARAKKLGFKNVRSMRLAEKSSEVAA